MELLDVLKRQYLAEPFFARTYLSICLLISALASLGLVSPYHIFFTFQQTFLEFNIWRPFTAFLFLGKISYNFLFNAYFAYFILKKVET